MDNWVVVEKEYVMKKKKKKKKKSKESERREWEETRKIVILLCIRYMYVILLVTCESYTTMRSIRCKKKTRNNIY
jgi:hypothetical protein